MSVKGSVSVVIRIRNEAESLKRVLRALEAQSLRPCDLVIVDNFSTDGSREVALKHGAKIVDISTEEFTYGRALNMGIKESEGEFIVILSAHSLPLGRDFLSKTVEPFERQRVAGVRCLHAGNREELQAWTEQRILDDSSTLKSVISYGPVACACAIRRAVWQAVPFDEDVVAVEDKFWALEVLKRGHLVSSSQAMYLYIRDLGFLEFVKKINRDRLEFFRRTGVEWQEPAVSLSTLLKNIFRDGPRRFVRTAAQQILIYLHLRTIQLQARRKRKIGSIR
jgi:rhamnosyltransferase